MRMLPVRREPANRRSRFRCFAAGLIGLLFVATVPAFAQITPQPLPPQGDVSRERVPLPPVETPQFDLRIQAPERSAVPKAVDAIEFEVRKVEVEGATRFPPGQVNDLFAHLIGKTVGLDDIRAAAQRLEDLYRKEDYFLTRVFIPPQQIDDATVKITVVEGYVDDIAVEGLDERTRRTASAVLAPLRNRRPADLPSVERQLLILNDMPGVAAASVLRQGSQFGASDLTVSLTIPRNTYAFNINNTNSRILGPWTYVADANFNRPIGLPGALNIGLSAGGKNLRGVQSAIGRYTLAVGTDGLIVSLGALAATARPGGSLRVLDIRNRLLSLSARTRYPLIRGRANSLFLEGGLSINRSETDILGQRLIEDRTTVGDIGLTFQNNGWKDGATTVTASVFHGLPAFGASDQTAPLPSVLDFDPRFVRLIYSVQRLQRLSEQFSALVLVRGQYTTAKLLSGELASFGGPSIGRGFDPSAITGDRGLGGLAELRYDLAIANTFVYNSQFYTFLDHATTSNLATPTVPGSSQQIRSAGVGVRLYHQYGVVDLQGAYARREIGGTDERPNPRALLSATFLY